MNTAWIGGLLKTRGGRIGGAIAGIALTVALLASLGVFMRDSGASMTQRCRSALNYANSIPMISNSYVGI